MTPAVGPMSSTPQFTKLESLIWDEVRSEIAAWQVLETRHAERVGSALCAGCLAFISGAAHLVMGFSITPIFTNYAGREVHTVRWAAQVGHHGLVLG
jgi:hypothetical protein